MTVLLSDLDVSIRGDVFADVVGGHGTSSRGQGSSSSSGSSATPTLSFVCEESCPNSGFMVINPTSARRQADAMRILYAWSISKSSPTCPPAAGAIRTASRRSCAFLGPNGPEEERRYNGKAFGTRSLLLSRATSAAASTTCRVATTCTRCDICLPAAARLLASYDGARTTRVCSPCITTASITFGRRSLRCGDSAIIRATSGRRVTAASLVRQCRSAAIDNRGGGAGGARGID